MSPKWAERTPGTPKWVTNMRRGMHYRSELFAQEFELADERVLKAAGMPQGNDKEAKLRNKFFREAEATRKKWWDELCSLANQYRRLNNDNVFMFMDGSADVLLDSDACDANQKAFRLERQASGNRLAAIVRRGMQLNPKRLHQPQPPEAASAAAQRAQDPEDVKGLKKLKEFLLRLWRGGQHQVQRTTKALEQL